MAAPGTAQNDIWSVLSKGVDNYFAYQTAKVQTQAAPIGVPVYPNFSNNPPGTAGAYPQAEAKPKIGASNGAIARFGIFGAGALVVVLLLVFLLRR